ncbi:MAG: fumarylacetoacetate hydrolase family protein [Anaerolineaceae bacterium]|nr:fumarylacetoacetate hydrolase family protein [Anaerolineaceae bacterium]
MLTDAERNQVVEALLEANRTRVQTTRPSALFPHIEFEDAYAISAEVARRQQAAGARLIGYKVGLTSIAMRRSSKIDEPDFGFLYNHFLIEDGARVPHANYCVPRVELELAFILGQPLRGPGVNLLDVLRATEFVIPAIEIIDTRVDEPRKIYDTIADNGAGAGIVLGGRPFHPRDLNLRMVPGILYRNTEIEETGLSCGVMGHPANGVAWLANKLSTLGYALEPGQMLLAGSFVRPVWAQIGDTIRADFGELGSVAIQFS